MTEMLASLREEAEARYVALGLPTVADEAWRYVNLGVLRKGAFQLSGLVDADEDALPVTDFGGAVLVLVNGRFVPALSRLEELDGVTVTPLADALVTDATLATRLKADDGRALTALNTALWADGLVIRADKPVAKPLTLLYVSAPGEAEEATHPRLFVDLAPSAELTLIEIYQGRSELLYWVNPVREVTLGANAGFKAVTLYDEGPAAIHTGLLKVVQKRDSRFEHRALSLGGKVVRHEVHVRLEEPGVLCNLMGAALAASGQTLDTYTEMHHLAPHGTSHQTFRSVADAKGTTAYQGRIVVHEDAQKTDAIQSSRNLLLAKGAEANTKPELEIYADDVKCAHGATVGELDEDMLFYLESRGIDPVSAKAMLIEAFVGGVIDDLPVAALEDLLRARVAGWMQGRAIAGDPA
ncbi:Fe-S cluster assembly protein SufD [Govanella unica]|uniref:Fe-S cluster assembly protein SufD n=1 Tax=Govanella unica TaxID=2975056 RepID=A0A9X3TU38_9PROT|nr:Fe-S cluster assembly protein SufD [Govania unica]MDA5192396.1 Fe-S cluster assembly protein SufD [Govania unica]